MLVCQQADKDKRRSLIQFRSYLLTLGKWRLMQASLLLLLLLKVVF